MSTTTNMWGVTDVRVHRFDDRRTPFATIDFKDEHGNTTRVFTNDLAGLVAQINAAAAPKENDAVNESLARQDAHYRTHDRTIEATS